VSEGQGLSPDEEQDVPVAELPEQDQNASVLDQLRKKREDVTINNEVDIPIPGYDQEPPILVARYHLIDGREVDRISRKVSQEVKDRWDRVTLSSVDIFIASCVGMFYDMQTGDGLQPMTLNGEPITGYTPQLATALGFEAGTARQVVYGVFANNDVAIATHNVRLSRWMSNTSVKVDEDFLGEG
jgi:hypothetical protein